MKNQRFQEDLQIMFDSIEVGRTLSSIVGANDPANFAVATECFARYIDGSGDPLLTGFTASSDGAARRYVFDDPLLAFVSYDVLCWKLTNERRGNHALLNNLLSPVYPVGLSAIAACALSYRVAFENEVHVLLGHRVINNETGAISVAYFSDILQRNHHAISGAAFVRAWVLDKL